MHGWQLASFAQNFSEDETQFDPPSPVLLEQFNGADLMLLLNRASIALPSRTRKSELVEMIITNWAQIVLGEVASSEAPKNRSRTEVLREAFSLNVTHIDINDPVTGRVRHKPLEKCAVPLIEEAITAKKSGMVFSLTDEDTPSVVDAMESPPDIQELQMEQQPMTLRRPLSLPVISSIAGF